MQVTYFIYVALFHLFVLVQQFVVFCSSLKPHRFLHGGAHHDLRYIKEHIHHLKKVPVHLALVVEDEISLKEISDIICWSIGGGIRFITLYDMKGALKQKANDLQYMILEKSASFFGPSQQQYSKVSLHISPLTEPIQLSDTLATSLQDNGEYHLYITSAIDGRAQIAQLASRVCKTAYSSSSSSSSCESSPISNPTSISQSFICDNIKGFPIDNADNNNGSVAPDPDLVIAFDSSIVMSGFMPWHLRLTEILHMGPLQDFTLQQYIRGLYSYSKTDRRHGV